MYIMMFVIGACLGSFVNVVLMRRDWYKGRSRCDCCGYQLRWFDLVPIVSFCLLKGKCRKCGAKIDILHIASEVFMGSGFAVASLHFSKDIMTATVILTAVVFLCICAISDTKEKAISVLYLYGGIVCVACLRLFDFALKGDIRGFGVFTPIYVPVYLLLVFISRKCGRYIGEGDFDILMIMLLAVGFFGTIRSITIASLTGTCLYLPLIAVGRYDRQKPLPFAPLLYVGFVINILGGGILF